MEKTFKCSCYAHELHVELAEDHDINLIDITMWSVGNETGSGWWFRLKLIWQVIRLGHGYKDMVCLHPQEARQLGKTLQQFADVAEFRAETHKQPISASPV